MGDEILGHKQPGRNLMLITHSACMSDFQTSLGFPKQPPPSTAAHCSSGAAQRHLQGHGHHEQRRVDRRTQTTLITLVYILSHNVFSKTTALFWHV